MARLKTWADYSSFSAADANSLALEVPPAATTQTRTDILTIQNLTNFAVATPARPLRVSRQGLQVTLRGGVIVQTAGYIQGETLRPIATLLPEFRPAEPVSVTAGASVSTLNAFQVLVNSDGTINLLRYQGTQPAGMLVQFSMSWSVEA